MARASKIQDGIAVILKYEPSATTAAEHDVIYCGSSGAHPDQMTPEDRALMKTAGWDWDEELNCWSRFT